jgi:hypothetical protein
MPRREATGGQVSDQSVQGVIETGWLSQDAGDLAAAAGWSRRAKWAHCAGDTRMAAHMLIRQANIATLTDDHAAVIQLAKSGCSASPGRLVAPPAMPA